MTRKVTSATGDQPGGAFGASDFLVKVVGQPLDAGDFVLA